MWPKFVNSKLFTIVISSSVSIILFIAAQRITEKKEDRTELRKELDQKATYNYVDQQDAHLKVYVDQHISDDRVTNDKLLEYIKSMDHKIDIILSKK